MPDSGEDLKEADRVRRPLEGAVRSGAVRVVATAEGRAVCARVAAHKRVSVVVTVDAASRDVDHWHGASSLDGQEPLVPWGRRRARRAGGGLRGSVTTAGDWRSTQGRRG